MSKELGDLVEEVATFSVLKSDFLEMSRELDNVKKIVGILTQAAVVNEEPLPKRGRGTLKRRRPRDYEVSETTFTEGTVCGVCNHPNMRCLAHQ